jgi:hypothetical protein
MVLMVAVIILSQEMQYWDSLLQKDLDIQLSSG